MTAEAWLPVLILLSSLIAAVLIFPLGEQRQVLRTTFNMAGAIIKVGLVALVVLGAAQGITFETRLPFLPGLDFVLRVDRIALIFMVLSAGLWLLTTLYAVGYLEGSHNRSRFFGYFSLCVTATMGIALAGNLITFFIFYELLTVTTYPLVVHRGSQAAIAAGKTYLLYTLTGGVVLLVGVVWLQLLAGPVEFTPGGVLGALALAQPTELTLIFLLLVGGLGVKAALVPLHGWLPEAMVAPAPVSALLHAVAVVKAGAYGIVRVIHDLYGVDVADSLGVLLPLAVLAGVTIIYGSLRALAQDELKRRLAYSTVSQISYITLGAALLGPVATVAALVHLMHQGLMKVTLFFCVGNLAETLNISSVRQVAGVGRRMPLTMAAFTIAALGMMGVPPVAGFISKWFLGLGGLAAGEPWVLLVLAASSLLNAAYFLPIILLAWFGKPPVPSPETKADHPLLHPPTRHRFETSWMLLVPALATAALALAAGLFAGAPFSPLDLANFATQEIYR